MEKDYIQNKTLGCPSVLHLFTFAAGKHITFAQAKISRCVATYHVCVSKHITRVSAYSVLWTLFYMPRGMVKNDSEWTNAPRRRIDIRREGAACS